MKKFFLASVVALSVFVGAQSVSALTASEAEAIIAALGLSGSQATAIRALATPATPAVSYTRQLGVGAKGDDVSALQSMLINGGYLMISAPTGYFGPATKAAVAAYQAKNGISATGYVGPMTLAKLNAAVVVVPPVVVNPPVNNDTTTLEGTDGTINDVSKLSQYNNEEIGDGESDVKVVGFEVEASNDGDIALKSVKLTFDGSANAYSSKITDYVDSVSVWNGTSKIGSADASDFNKDSTGVYSKTITLKGNTVVNSDDTSKFYVTIDAASNLDSQDIAGSNDAWTIDVDSIRYEDGSGVVTTDVDTGDLGAALDNVAISFVSFSTAADTELKISLDSSSPDAGVITADENDNTDDVLLLVGKMKVEGTSDVLLNELPITLTVTGAADVDIVTGSVKLVIDGEEYSESVSTASVTSATTTFDNLDLTLDAGKTYTFKVLADVNDIEAGTFDEGDTLTASLTSTNVDYIDAENEEGDQLADNTEKTGSANGESQAFYLDGLNIAKVSTNIVKVSDADPATVGSADTKTFEVVFKVTAGSEDIFIDKSIVRATSTSDAADNAAGSGTAWATTTDSTSLVTNNGVSTISASGDESDDTANVYKVNSGESRTFTLAVTLTATDDGYTSVSLVGVNWTTDAADTTPDNQYTFNLDDFKTSKVYMQKI